QAALHPERSERLPTASRTRGGWLASRCCAASYRSRLLSCPLRVRSQQLENRSQSLLDGGQPLARVAAEQLVDLRLVGERRRRLFLKLPSSARKRQAFDEQQVLDTRDLLDVGAPVDARTARGLRDAQSGKLDLPRSQHVRLQLHEIADLGGLEQRAVGNLERNGFSHFRQMFEKYSSVYTRTVRLTRHHFRAATTAQTASTAPNGHAPCRNPYADPIAHANANASVNQ